MIRWQECADFFGIAYVDALDHSQAKIPHAPDTQIDCDDSSDDSNGSDTESQTSHDSVTKEDFLRPARVATLNQAMDMPTRPSSQFSATWDPGSEMHSTNESVPVPPPANVP